jgi:NAD(P)H-quinone oxidoreductase subunit 5
MGLAFLTGAAGLMGLPPFAGFAALGELLTLAAQSSAPALLMPLVLLANTLICAGLVRVFALTWGGTTTPFSHRSAEVLWLMSLPTLVLSGLVLHLPILLVHLGVLAPTPLPGWGSMAWPLLISTLVGIGVSAGLYLGDRPLARPIPSLGGLQDWLAHDMQTERFYHRTVVAVVLALSRLAAWSELRVIDGFSGSSGGAALAGARRLSFTTSGRSQGYALTLLLGVLVMAAWLLVARP